VVRFTLACAVTAAALAVGAPVAAADPGDPGDPSCPVTDPPVINRCGPDPAPPPPPVTRVAMCQDGAFTITQHPYWQGTCLKHGGVAQWITDN
jgi:hypothetical protein